MSRRIGIFGGSFDPPHVGHLFMALDAIDALSLDSLHIVPAAVQPLKREGQTEPMHRLAMTRLCFEEMAGIEVNPLEMDRGGLSFTVDTAEAFRQRWSSSDLFLIVGEDAAASFARWREPERLLTMVQLVVLQRTLSDSQAASVALSSSSLDDLRGARPVTRLATRRVDVSSTEIRDRVRKGLPIRGFVPDAVAHYIATNRLYLQEPSTAPSPALA